MTLKVVAKANRMRVNERPEFFLKRRPGRLKSTYQEEREHLENEEESSAKQLPSKHL